MTPSVTLLIDFVIKGILGHFGDCCIFSFLAGVR